MFEITKEKMNKISDCYPPKGYHLLMYFEDLDRYYYQTYWYDGKPYKFQEHNNKEFYPSHWIALK